MLKGILDVRSKTFWGVMLGALGILLDTTELIELPDIVGQIVTVIGGVITAMGLRDKMVDSQAGIIAKIIDIKSRTFWGALIVGITYIVDNSDTMPIPEDLLPVVKIVGALITAMGIRDAKAKQARKKA